MKWLRREWQAYCMDCYYSEDGFHPTLLGFMKALWKQYVARFVCRWRGHDIVDCSSAGPESGNMDCCCDRCGRYWSIPLY